MKLEFVANHPLTSDEPEYIPGPFPSDPGQSPTRINAAPAVNTWARQFTQGLPQATKTGTVEELQAKGIVGLYREVEGGG